MKQSKETRLEKLEGVKTPSKMTWLEFIQCENPELIPGWKEFLEQQNAMYVVEKAEGGSYVVFSTGEQVPLENVPADLLTKAKWYGPNQDGITVSPEDWKEP